ncbi:protein rolling stone-like isoform X2 [Hylaeus volcanicus]|uniref:protein rolling stone-like isoform X2 n=1 Tax=Hylaeus volcanicus TaxID=313075 RepID=UPI0023B78D8D|nr:protein rolling stone-like isoform X2 [Hylaeus volcanicus]
MVLTTLYWSLSIPKRFLVLLVQCSSCRRAMVNKFWCHEVARKWFLRKAEPPHARQFSEPKCQQHVATWYLLYRWLIFLAWTCIIVCSIFEFGSYKPMIAYDKWPIYLTNWDLMLGLCQALLGGLLVSRRWKLQKVSDFNPSTLTIGFTERAYWFFYIATTGTAFCVSISYWCSIYDPKVHHLDPLNIMLHVCNSVLMTIDFCVTNVPFRLKNFWWCLSIPLLYTIFSLMYYLAGGLDKNGEHYIYKILDWKKPLRSSLVCAGEFVFITVVYSIACLLEQIKNQAYAKFVAKSYTVTKNSVTEKRADIV